ncbi:DUF4349 domain-containing protein [Hamadaea tsunoensis]|uniref:DUF4349 domain-containing protein n=1 Tax=Hamadaea tsunoensis TaxID=53368 RepID=UPI000404E77B|nr:DUF4349 domain-containing protein [Hamadaea tsunoensis]
MSTRSLRRPLAAAGLVVLLATGGCAASSDSGATSSDAGAPAPAAQAPGADEKAAGGGTGYTSAPGGQTANDPAAYARSIIYNGQITVRVEHVSDTATRVRTLATSSGGFVGDEKSDGSPGHEESTLTLRVPADKFGSILDDLAKLGTELSRSLSTQDVTDTVVDLDARIAAQKASVDSVRRMFTQAKQLSEVVLLEKELTQRQAELDSLMAKKRHLDDLVTLSTITITLVGPQTPYVQPKKADPTFLGGLSTGWDTFVTMLKVASAVLGFLLPFLLVLAVILVPLLVWRRRRKTPRASSALKDQESTD